jgi:hypothetical protein
VATISESERRELERFVASALPGARLVGVRALGADSNVADRTRKGTGYGAPIRLDVEREGRVEALVLHTATPNEFGHDRRADRAAELVLAADTFGLLPDHTRVVDVGAYAEDGGFVSLKHTGEFYLLTTWAEGTPYAQSLREVGVRKRALAQDVQKAERLAGYLAELHREPLRDRAAYVRSLRDLVGAGEGIFGIADGYADDVPGADRARLEKIELLCVEARHRLRQKHHRLRRVHGDFHPFNLLFDDIGKLSLLDASRGCLGDPADDVTALAVNYLFFALEHEGSWREGFRPLWQRFFERYLGATRDDELADVVAPFFAWRALVLACPTWYPKLRAESRERLLGFVESLLEGRRFTPELGDELFTP